jgi:soluble lytic murein transglycosylase
LIVFAVFTPFLRAEMPADEVNAVRAAVQDRDYPAAVVALQKLDTADSKSFELNNFDYLLARMAEKAGDIALAMANYQRVVRRGSVLEPYALKHLSEIARDTGNLTLERFYLQKLVTFYPDGLLQLQARSRLARSFFESGNFGETVRLLTSSPAGNSSQAPADRRAGRDDLLLLARSFDGQKRSADARAAYMRLINELPDPAQPDDVALEAARALDADLAGLTDQDHLQRASIYQFNRDFTGARAHYTAILEKFPDSGIAPDAAYQIGRGYASESNYVEAIHWFERVLEQYPDHPVSADALLQAASAYSRVAKYKESVRRYQRFIERYPDDSRLERAYLNIVDVLRDAGSDSDALKWAAKTQEVFRGKLPEALALFAEARIYLAKSDWDNALSSLTRLEALPDLGGTRVPGGTNPAEVFFLKAYVLEQQQRYPECIDAYLTIPDGRGEYYGGRATARLLMLAANENTAKYIRSKAESLTAAEGRDLETRRLAVQSLLRLTNVPGERSRLLATLKEIYAALPKYRKTPSFKLLTLGRNKVLKSGEAAADAGSELAFLGLYDEATPELMFGRKSASQTAISPAPDDLSYTLAVYFGRGDMAERAVAFAEPLWRNIPADYQIELIPRDQLEMLYPAPFNDLLVKFAKPRGVDPRFLLSIIRQESRYRADVKSNAAARGLMQFISSTAERIAAELGRKSFANTELFNPPTAILFGSHYLYDLFAMLPAQEPAVAASYNAGEDNVKRWMARSKSNLPEVYVPEIAFSQSKDYTYKVMSNYRIYQYLYSDLLRTK